MSSSLVPNKCQWVSAQACFRRVVQSGRVGAKSACLLIILYRQHPLMVLRVSSIARLLGLKYGPGIYIREDVSHMYRGV